MNEATKNSFVRKTNKRPPKFKKLRKYKSFTLKQAGWSLDEKNHTITIHKQKYHYHKSREIEGIVKTVTVKRNSLGEIYIFLVCQVAQQNEVLHRMGKSIGFDFGFKGHILVAPTKEDDVAAPRFFRKNRNKLKKMQRRIAKKFLANTDHFVKKGKGLKPIYKRPLWQCKTSKRLLKPRHGCTAKSRISGTPIIGGWHMIYVANTPSSVWKVLT